MKSPWVKENFSVLLKLELFLRMLAIFYIPYSLCLRNFSSQKPEANIIQNITVSSDLESRSNSVWDFHPPPNKLLWSEAQLNLSRTVQSILKFKISGKFHYSTESYSGCSVPLKENSSKPLKKPNPDCPIDSFVRKYSYWVGEMMILLMFYITYGTLLPKK